MKEYTDSEIIECLRNRKNYVVRYLWSRYMPMIRLMVSHTGGTCEDAKDVFQDGLLIMIEKIDEKNFALTCKFKTLLFCICKHLWNLVLAKRKAANNYLNYLHEDDPESDIIDIIDNKYYHEIFRESYNSLQEDNRKILRLYWDEVPPKEIAERFGYSYGYVRKKKCKAQAELIRKIKSHPNFPIIKKSEKEFNPKSEIKL